MSRPGIERFSAPDPSSRHAMQPKPGLPTSGIRVWCPILPPWRSEAWSSQQHIFGVDYRPGAASASGQERNSVVRSGWTGDHGRHGEGLDMRLPLQGGLPPVDAVAGTVVEIACDESGFSGTNLLDRPPR